MSEYNHYFFLIFLVLYSNIKSERWWSRITGYNLLDHNHGYSGSSQVPCRDFYLCGKRNYRVHYLGDDPLNWSKNFSNCDPVGVGREIDGICIYGEKSYKGRLHEGIHWMHVIKGCNISDENGYAGELGTSLACIAINGKDVYRMAYKDIHEEFKPSNPKNTSDRIIKTLFGEGIINKAEYDKEYELNLLLNDNNKNKINYFNASVQLLENENINLNGGEFKFVIYDESIIYSPWDGKVLNKLIIKKLRDIINFDFYQEIKNFEKIIVNDILHGLVTIHSNYEKNRIYMDIAIKVISDVDSFRGGLRINLILKNTDKFIELIKKLLKIISGYISKEKRNQVLGVLKTFNEIKELDGIMKLISPYDSIFTQIIFLYIIKS